MNCQTTYTKRANISLDLWLKTSKYCSRKCMQAINPGAKAVKGKPAWNSGTKGICKPNSGSIKKGEHRGYDTQFKKGQNLNEDNVNWKGENAGYNALHYWVKARKPLVGRCQWCGENRYTEISNLDYQYTRDLSKWVELCASCHKTYDRKNGWGIATKKFGLHNG